MFDKSQFIKLEFSNKIWAIGSIHANLESFELIKQHVVKNFTIGDKLVFLGNVIGFGDHSKETLSSVVNLRNFLLSKFFLNPEDVVFLRGAQEEMFLKLLQLETAPNPLDIIRWMFEHGVDQTLLSYGISKDKIIDIANQGTLSINRWTKSLNKIVKNIPAHNEYFLHLKHAAFSNSKKILFVNRGVDVSRPLSAQNDCFWWGYQNFSKIDKPYKSFTKIVRGYSSSTNNFLGNNKKDVVCSLYIPPLESKKIMGGLFNNDGEILDLFESK